MSVYALIDTKPFTLAELAHAELNRDGFSVDMTSEQRDFYLHTAIEIGAREAARYPGQDVNALAMQLGARVQDGREPYGSGVYAEYDAETHQITVHGAGVRLVSLHLTKMAKTVPEYATLKDAAQDALFRIARELLIAHELFHHLEATRLGSIHRTLPPISVPLLGNFWKVKRYVRSTREIAAHSFAHHLLGIAGRFPIENI
ncbi:MAG: hypothetical protein JWN14_3663 [Chthonomonadales bacterium]|nr:hypothetical protein [Chthonomonadales bacterium]